MSILAFAGGALLGAAANRYAGWEKGNRYLPAVILWLALYAVWGFEATVFGLAFLFWRSIGWYESIDMGRNEGTLLGDFAKMVGITLLPLATVAVMYPTPWLIGLAFAPAVAYAAVMWGLPWRPEFRHIAVAEIVTGALIGVGAVAVVTA
jgi:hypothetical protein